MTFFSFADFWVTKLKLFSGKARKTLQDHLHPQLVRGSFLENGFETNLSSKGNVFNPWTCYFSALQRFERPSWKGKPSRPFSFKVGHSKHFRKWFWSYLEIKKECCEHSKKNAFQKNAFLEMLFSFYLTVLDNLYKIFFEYFKCFKCIHLNILKFKNFCRIPCGLL